MQIPPRNLLSEKKLVGRSNVLTDGGLIFLKVQINDQVVAQSRDAL